MKNWREIPITTALHKGDIKKIWYNHAIVPLWAAIGLASVVCGGFMIKYFGGHTEISWSKSMRATYDHQVRPSLAATPRASLACTAASPCLDRACACAS